MSEENIDSGELGITFGGRVLLKKLLKDLKVNSFWRMLYTNIEH